MHLLKVSIAALSLILLLPSEVASKARSYQFRNDMVTYEEAWENCKAMGMQLGTAQSLEDHNELGRLLNQPQYKGQDFWATDQQIDRTVPWGYTFNEEEMTLHGQKGQWAKTRCLLVRSFQNAGTLGTDWNFDLCRQRHKYICDRL